MLSPLAGKRSYWLRQLRPDTSERTYTGIIQTMQRIGLGTVLTPKIADGLAFQGNIDPTTGMFSTNDLKNLVDMAKSTFNVDIVPVVVPRGEDYQKEAEIHAEIANVTKSLITDIEPYDGFWDHDIYDNIPKYAEKLRNSAPNAYLINQPDPRFYGVRDGRVIESASYFNGIMCQHYVGSAPGWMNVDAEVLRFRDLISRTHLDPHVTIAGTGDLKVARGFYELIVGEIIGLNVFALGAMNTAQLTEIGSWELPRIPEPPAPDPDIDYNGLLLRSGIARELAQASADMFSENPYDALESHLNALQAIRDKLT